MDEIDFEGTLVLEKLAEMGKVDSFFNAIDADDFVQVKKLMRQAGLDKETIQIVIKKMNEANGK